MTTSTRSSTHRFSPGQLTPIVVLAFLIAAIGPCRAQSIEEVREAHDNGRFLEAAELGESLSTSESLTIASLSLTIHGFHVVEGDDAMPFLVRAAELAERAIDQDGDNVDARVALSRALGRQAQTMGTMKAANLEIPQKLRRILEQALEMDPASAAAHLGFGMWNSEVVDGAGSFLAGLMYGASKDKALYAFEKSLELAPDEKIVLYEVALGLERLDASRYADRIRELLMHALEIPIGNAFDSIIHTRITERFV